MLKFAVSINARDTESGVIDYLMHTYVPYLQTLGIAPLLVPNTLADVNTYLAALKAEGLILTGGGDLDPAYYKQTNTHSIRIMAARDKTEFALLDWATTHNRPVLGICRGIQTINVYCGGGLVQDIPAQIGNRVDHDDTTHPVQIVDDQIAECLGTRDLITNSHHHQSITADILADDLIPFAISKPDGVIEGVLHRSQPIMGVQWHPERPTPSHESDLRLFQHFLDRGAFWST